MAISYVGGQVGVNTLTIPTHQVGDLIIAFAYRDGNNTAPTVPNGWTLIGTASGGNSNSSVACYKIAQSTSETFGTFTNATSVLCHVYRGAKDVGGQNSNGAQSTTVNYPAVTMQVTDGSSWVVGFAGHRSVNTNLQNPPTGMVLRTPVLDATDEAAGFDTDGGVTQWNSTNVSIGGTSSGWRSRTIELLALNAYSLTAETSTFSLSFSQVDTNRSYAITFENGSFAINGQSVNYQLGKSISVEFGAFSVSGQAVDFETSKSVSVTSAEYVLNGNTAQITAQRSISSENGLFELNGQESQINAQRKASAQYGEFALVGQNATITADGQIGYTLLAGFGQVTLTGQSVQIRKTAKPTTQGSVKRKPVFTPPDYREQIMREDEMILMFVNEMMKGIKI
jgi:hypothetical protein